MNDESPQGDSARPSDDVRLMFLIRSLNRGGAERQLVALAAAVAKRHPVLVVTFYPGGPFWDELVAHSVRVLSLHKRGRWDLARFSWRLWRLLREWRPHVLQTYLPEPNIFGLLLGRPAGVPAIVWGVRSSDMMFEHHEDVALQWTFRGAAALSRWADLTIVNSEAGRRHHLARGFSGSSVVIPNGIDTDGFRRERSAGMALRRVWGIAPDHVLVGMVARLDPMKGHREFLQAAALLSAGSPHLRFACVGHGSEAYAAQLRSVAGGHALEGRLVWAQEQGDMMPVYNAFDIACSASRYGEGFSNALGEAMACGLPCVATDVGDAAVIIGDTGAVVQPGSPPALADALERMARLSVDEREEVGRAARLRIVQHYSVAAMVERTLDAYRRLISHTEPS